MTRGRSGIAPLVFQGDVPDGEALRALVRASRRRPRPALDLPTQLGPLQRIAMAAVRLYQRRLSERVGAICAYEPSCSDYAILAVAYQGAGRGLISTVRRLARCRPQNRGQIDYPEGVPVVPN